MRRLVSLATVGVLLSCGGDDDSSATVATPLESGSGVAVTVDDPPLTTSTEPAEPQATAPRATVAVPDTTASVPSLPTAPFLAADLFEPQVGIAVPNGENGSWDDVYTDPGAVVVDSAGVIHMLHNGFNSFPGAVGVAYSRSTDGGVTFERLADQPVFDSALAGTEHIVLASSVLIDDDGSWSLFYFTWEAGVWPVAPSRIWRATAPGPQGPWTPDEAPALEPGAAGSWDDLAVRSPSVVRDEAGFHMWFTGVSVGNVGAIGYATSADGITWEKRAEPVLGAGRSGEWDAGNVHQPRVTSGPDGYVMTYAGAPQLDNPNSFTQQHGLAVSADGIDWVRSAEPLLTASQFRRRNLWFSAIVWTGEAYLVFPEAGSNGSTDVFVARHQGPLSIGG